MGGERGVVAAAVLRMQYQAQIQNVDEYLQGDFENTFNFSINKYLSTQFHFHLRYDSSAESDPDWSKWQFKEILSFGFNYRI